MKSSIGGLLAATVLVLGLVAAPPTATAATATTEASPGGSAVAVKVGKPCNAKGYRTKVRKVRGRTTVVLTRLAEKTYAGKVTLKKGKRIRSETNRTVQADVRASGGLKLGAGGVLKKVVKVFSRIETGVTFTARVTSNKSESKYITVESTTRIPRASTVVFFAGRMHARGTAEYSYCSALEGSGEGYTKWQKVRWSSFGARGSGAQRCDLKAYGKIAAVAKRTQCA